MSEGDAFLCETQEESEVPYWSGRTKSWDANVPHEHAWPGQPSILLQWNPSEQALLNIGWKASCNKYQQPLWSGYHPTRPHSQRCWIEPTSGDARLVPDHHHHSFYLHSRRHTTGCIPDIPMLGYLWFQLTDIILNHEPSFLDLFCIFFAAYRTFFTLTQPWEMSLDILDLVEVFWSHQTPNG